MRAWPRSAAEKSALEERLTQPLAPADIANCGRRLKECSDEIAALEDRWLELGAALEALSAAADTAAAG